MQQHTSIFFDSSEARVSRQAQAAGERAPLPWWKRSMDLAILFLCLPALLLVSTFVALVIKIGSPGPLLFRQRRVGYRGKEFVCFKFRTMAVDAETESHRQHAQNLIKSKGPMVKLDARKDPRLIPLGGVLRACGLDELPQFLNVLRGEMSVVGPRPCIPYECEAYQSWHWARFDAVPGLTGLWQVSGKNHTTFDEMVQLDIEYTRRFSFWLDLKILVKTVPALWAQVCEVRGVKPRQCSQQATEAVESFS